MNEQISSSLKRVINARRSERVVARIRLLVRRRTDADGFMSEVSHTLVVNAHGALITLTSNVETGELLVIKNFLSSEEQDGRVVRVGDNKDRQKEVAIEFLNAAPYFWHIDFPPANWKVLQD